MKAFLKPTRWKILFAVLLFILLFILWLVVENILIPPPVCDPTGFSCDLYNPKPIIPVDINVLYDLLNTVLFLLLVISYILTCYFVGRFKKLHPAKSKK